MLLQFPEALFDLHALGVGAHDAGTGAAAVGQRGSQQPRGAMQAAVEAIVGAITTETACTPVWGILDDRNWGKLGDR